MKLQGTWLVRSAVLAVALVGVSCSEANRDSSPVELVANSSQEVLLIDLANPPAGGLGTILLRAIPKGSVISDYMDVRLQSYRVTYRRTDGGSLVPASFVRSTSGIIPVGGAAQSLNDFLIVQSEALSQAPFAALLPQNGGRDPETGQSVIKMDAFVEIYGETLGGERVRATTIIPLWFCVGCSTT